MDQVLALRPFVPAKDFNQSKRFYQALGFRPTHEDDSVAVLKQDSFSFILQKFHAKEAAENCMVQLLVRNVAAWWERIDPLRLDETFGVQPPCAPTIQPWGLKVGFLFDPSGILWHVAEAPF